MIGAGQAGLAIGHFLARQGRRFVILEAADAVGAAWRGRWDSLVLFTPRRYDALPGLAFPGDPDGYPTRDEVIAYLEQYAATFELPIEFDSPVRSLTPGGRRRSCSRSTGGGSSPTRSSSPPARSSGRACRQSPPGSPARSSRRTAPATAGRAMCPTGRVLVVGGGNTGFQIAKELSATHAVQLAIGSRQTPLPQSCSAATSSGG